MRVRRKVGVCAHLSAMTVAGGGPALYVKKAAALGPDPLREDADKEVRGGTGRRGAARTPV